MDWKQSVSLWAGKFWGIGNGAEGGVCQEKKGLSVFKELGVVMVPRRANLEDPRLRLLSVALPDSTLHWGGTYYWHAPSGSIHSTGAKARPPRGNKGHPGS